MPGGMDGSKDPVLTPETSVYYADNVVFRGGAGPKTRPGFNFINLPSSGVVNGSIVQCSVVYNPPDRQPVIVVVADGRVYVVDVDAVSVLEVGSLSLFNSTARCYACQVADYLVIQDGITEPKVLSWAAGQLGPTIQFAEDFDYKSQKTAKMPIGKQMAFGQGRLFVAINDREVVAGDIIFGGSTVSVEIKYSYPANYSGNDTPGLVVIETTTDHPFQVGDYVSITGHDNGEFAPSGTYVVQARLNYNTATPPAFQNAPAGATSKHFTIHYLTEAGIEILRGTGGQASLFKSGTQADALRFSETTFINEGGSLRVPSEIGKITNLTFVPLQDVSTGQGELVVFGNSGATSFAVSAPRNQWKELEGFQRLLFSEIGSLSDSTISVNGDIYFRSLQGNGLRTYRNARAEFGGFGMTPTSSELDSVFLAEDTSKLSTVSFIHFDDRLLFTCRPKTEQNYTTFRGIAALDFRPVSSNSAKTNAVYDGVWSGLKVVNLLKTEQGGVERAFALCKHDKFELWEITKNQTTDTKINSSKRITSLILTKAFDFESPWSEKRLLHGDLWFSNIKDTFDALLWFRPDNNPNWQLWGQWQLCFNNLPGYSSRLRSSPPSYDSNQFTNKLVGRGYDFKMRIQWEGSAQIEKALFHSHKLVEAMGVSFDIPSSTCVTVAPDLIVDSLENSYTSY